MKRRRQDNSRDRMIEQEYYKQATGRQINILNIPPLFRSVSAAMDNGVPLDQAMTAAILTYCEPVKA